MSVEFFSTSARKVFRSQHQLAVLNALVQAFDVALLHRLGMEALLQIIAQRESRRRNQPWPQGSSNAANSALRVYS